MAEGEFWVDEAEFRSQFDDVTVGYPLNEEGYLRSIYTGWFSSKLGVDFLLAVSFHPDSSPL